jgi:hypothetical protein
VGADWSYVQVQRNVCPFLVLFPFLGIPDELSGTATTGERGAKTNRLWMRAASSRDGIIPHLAALAAELKVADLMPEGRAVVPDFARMKTHLRSPATGQDYCQSETLPFAQPTVNIHTAYATARPLKNMAPGWLRTPMINALDAAI